MQQLERQIEEADTMVSWSSTTTFIQQELNSCTNWLIIAPMYNFAHLILLHPNISIWYVNSDIRDVSCSKSNVQKLYLGILWKSSCILALASLPWHLCLNQCECISGRKPSASLSTAASFIVCFCRQIQEFDAPTVNCEKYSMFVCVFRKVYSFPHQLSLVHSFMTVALTLYECVHACVCVWLLGIQRNKDDERRRKKMNDSAQSDRAKQSKN